MRNIEIYNREIFTNNFSVKDKKKNVLVHTYSSESEVFTGHDAYKLDEWVFEQFSRFLGIAPHNQTLQEMLSQDGVVFFLHLLGLDTNGHTNKPHSMQVKLYFLLYISD